MLRVGDKKGTLNNNHDLAWTEVRAPGLACAAAPADPAWGSGQALQLSAERVQAGALRAEEEQTERLGRDPGLCQENKAGVARTRMQRGAWNERRQEVSGAPQVTASNWHFIPRAGTSLMWSGCREEEVMGTEGRWQSWMRGHALSQQGLRQL